MKKEIIVTADGSHSVAVPELGVTYHSTHGAIQESQHIFIEAGLQYVNKKRNNSADLSIFEMGLGTGLNALVTLCAANQQQQKIYYESIEPWPLEASTYNLLNYCEQLKRPGLETVFSQIHACPWNSVIKISPFFSFKKINTSLAEYTFNQGFDIIYFDAFAPDIQPELWTADVFKKLYQGMHVNAVLTTYCSKSIVRKAMAEAGLQVTKIPGPPHKREMVRAVKPAA